MSSDASFASSLADLSIEEMETQPGQPYTKSEDLLRPHSRLRAYSLLRPYSNAYNANVITPEIQTDNDNFYTPQTFAAESDKNRSAFLPDSNSNPSSSNNMRTVLTQTDSTPKTHKMSRRNVVLPIIAFPETNKDPDPSSSIETSNIIRSESQRALANKTSAAPKLRIQQRWDSSAIVETPQGISSPNSSYSTMNKFYINTSNLNEVSSVPNNINTKAAVYSNEPPQTSSQIQLRQKQTQTILDFETNTPTKSMNEKALELPDSGTWSMGSNFTIQPSPSVIQASQPIQSSPSAAGIVVRRIPLPFQTLSHLKNKTKSPNKRSCTSIYLTPSRCQNRFVVFGYEI